MTVSLEASIIIPWKRKVQRTLMSKSTRLLRSTRVLMIAGILTLLTVGALACEMTFVLTDSSANSRTVIPGKKIVLKLGETYSLVVRFKEDHNNCNVAPEVTLFLLDEEKWKSSKDYLPLQLAGSVNWSDINSRTHETELTFKAVKTGDWELEVIRECSKKEGYDEYLLFWVN